MKDKKYFVYITTNIQNGMQYVGDHCGLEDDKYLGSGALIKKDINILGKQSFKREILEFFDSKQEAFDNQEKYIIQFNTLYPNGYNLSPKGGNNGKDSGRKYPNRKKPKPMSNETKEKIRKTLSGNIRSEETRRKISKANKGRTYPNIVSIETRRKISKANKGKKHSEETKKKIGEKNKKSQTGKILSYETRRKISDSLKVKYTLKSL